MATAGKVARDGGVKEWFVGYFVFPVFEGDPGVGVEVGRVIDRQYGNVCARAVRVGTSVCLCLPMGKLLGVPWGAGG